MLTADYTFAFSDTGFILNANNVVAGTPLVDVKKVTGLDNTPFRITSREREGMDGGFVDAQFEKARLIVLEGEIYNATHTFLDTLKANFAPSTIAKPFYFQSPVVGERVLFAKSYGINYPWDTDLRFGVIRFQIQLIAEDPTIYSAATTGLLSIGGTSTGFGFPLAFPLGFGGTTSGSGALTLNNVGNKNADATFVITGPVTSPGVSNDTLGQKIVFNLTLAATDNLTVNLRNKTVVLNSTTNRRSTLLGTSKWFLLQPGINSIRFLGTPGGTAPSMSYIMRSAYR